MSSSRAAHHQNRWIASAYHVAAIVCLLAIASAAVCERSVPVYVVLPFVTFAVILSRSVVTPTPVTRARTSR